MFDWFKNMFHVGNANGGAGGVDPEAGVTSGQNISRGMKTQGWNEGTGEGTDWSQMTKKDYGDLGRAFQSQQVPNLIGGGINAGFDQNWLGEQTNIGSANGAKIS